MKKLSKILLIALAVLIIVSVIHFGFTARGRAQWNNYWHDIQKVDDLTLYQTRKDVEDTCRSMQASYDSDRLIWMQFHDDDNPEHKSWADAAMMRANKTASEYNNYILKNSYVWKNNIPDDIRMNLEYLGESPYAEE